MFIALFSPFQGVCMESSSPLAQADLPPKHGDEQNDGEAAEHPQVLKQEEDQLGGGVGLLLGYAVHLWELRGGERPDLSHVEQGKYTDTVILHFT